MSAELNFGPAHFALGEMAEKGEGAKADLVEAYVRYGVALQIGEKKAAERLQTIEPKLSAEQLQTARQKISDWFTINGP